ncbi:hypothetical protein AB0D18_24025, partial [Streptomyces sp. NPDC048442]
HRLRAVRLAAAGARRELRMEFPAEPAKAATFLSHKWGRQRDRAPSALVLRASVGHADRVAAIHDAIGRLPGTEVSGALYEGVGIAACISSGRTAAARLLEG